MAKVEARGVEFQVEDRGSGAPPFVFIHGWACDASFWEPQFENLAADHRCLNINLRGRGGSQAIGPYDPMTAARDVVAIMEETRIGPSILVGHSLGGLIALLVNDLRPDLVLGTVLGDSPLTAASGGGFAQTVQLIRNAGSMAVIEEPILSRFFIETTPDSVRQQVTTAMLGCPPEVGAGMLDNAGLFTTRMGELLKAADRKPFMAFWGARPLGNPERIRDACPLIRQEPMGDCGHFFQLEQPAITSALLRAFLDDVERDPRLNHG